MDNGTGRPCFFEHQRKCGIELMPSFETYLLLKKAGVIWRKQDAITWILIKADFDENETDRTSLILGEDRCQLVFNLKPLDSAFNYFSCTEELYGDYWRLIRNEKSQIVRYNLHILITNQLIRETKKIQIKIQSKEAYWAFILIPKYTKRDAIIELRENNRKLIFTTTEKFEQPGEDSAFICMTTEKIAMKEIYEYQISLWEKKNSGERILSNHIFSKTRNMCSSKTEKGNNKLCILLI